MQGQSPLNMMRPAERRSGKSPARPVRRRWWPILAPITIVIVLAVAWVWLWYYASAVADRTLAGWVEREAAAGRVYSCGSQSIGGFPFRIEAKCIDAAAQVGSGQPLYAVKARAISFTAEVWHPTRLVGEVSGPMIVADSNQALSWSADWGRARLTVTGLPPDPDAVSIQLDGAHVDRAGVSISTIFGVKTADLQGRVIGGSPHNHPVIEMTVNLVRATAPTLHPILAEPIDGEIDVVLRGLEDLSPKPWAVRWRELQNARDGGIEIKSLRLAKTNVIVVGAGKLSLNAQGKLDGLINVAIAGIENLVPLLGVDRMIGRGIDRLAGANGATAQGAAALDRLIPGLGGALRQTAAASIVENLKKMGQPSSIDKQPATVLPLRFTDGSVYLGMLRVGEVPPLW
jgi:hypothetical protein